MSEAVGGSTFRFVSTLGAAMMLLAGACGGTSSNSSGSGQAGQPPTAKEEPQASVGNGEGQLNVIAWEGYAQPQWVKPFEQKTGCQVNAKYAGSSDEMVTFMRNG